MALRERDLYVSTAQPRPVLAIVPPPPRRHGIAAATFVVLLAAVFAVPVVSAALDGPPPIPFEHPRGPSAAAIASLDKLSAIPGGDIPRSKEPVAGLAFVRCTGLWVSEPDGHAPRKLLALNDISSPAFSSDGRTIAFVRTTGGEQALWLSAADGSEVRRRGPITSGGDDVNARVTGLAWSPNGDAIAFALTDGTYGPVTGGSVIWTLDVASGRFERITTGWPAPTWHRKNLIVSGFEDAPDQQMRLVGGPERVVSPLNSGYDDLAVAVVPQGWWNSTRNGAAVLRETRNGLELAIRTGWNRRDRFVAKAPPGYRFPRYAQPTISQNGSRVAIDLLDPGSSRDLGLLDPETGKWQVLDYGWEPSASPTPTILGPISRSEARAASEMLLSFWARRFSRAQMLTRGHSEPSTFPWQQFGWALQDPRREAGRWVVPVIAYSYGKGDDPYASRSANVIVRRIDGRLTATPMDLGPFERMETITDAHAFAERVLGHSLPTLPPLPEGTMLQENYALSAWSYDGNTQVTINTVMPASEAFPKKRTASFTFGEDIDFSLGCGGAVNPQPVDVAGQPGMADRSAGINQVVWPATPEDMSGPYSVHSNLSREEVIELAEQMGTP